LWYEYKKLIEGKNGGFPNVSTCTNKEIAKRSVHRIGMNGDISQHTPSMRCMMREQIRKEKQQR
jgi:hypothetical protein